MKNLILSSSIAFALLTPITSLAQGSKKVQNPAKAQEPQKKDLKSEFSTLGDNSDVVERVKNMDTNQKVRVVQNRLVDRNNRVELAGNYAYSGGGDAYVQTQNVGARLEYHINPRWSLGVQYQKSYNTLTPEGENRLSDALADQKKDPGSTKKYPAVDYPLETQLATISYYPIYGKMNLFDTGIAQFDMYLQLGYGKMNLFSGSSDVMSIGLGSGVWLTQRLTTRLEARYQQYEDLLKTERRKQNNLQVVASLGILVW